ncbi:HAD family hydrolase [Natrinema hispanicum]|uniref:Haloacid dehalogenase superfamily, subfamily IA, variant 1 with third motif having Dx(3-4)D or Dx(3-4)E n=1 Tax=Natrinema hispanicum TaxID=392421 RepID=A0A1G6VGE5_9EURY|nr:HAD-IA family hydrolase [Natrinema hispanicum]SDD52722.1 haloacid dehalogenase superfamily, subfamily IA, variant 1 with third motif having Dx(3-4)D or Dx(3-4)E [Natrinema hispanicum]SEU13627.1 haloacid dehalogenase superfamily, subfamily IA, variant 1 with third motif having Dx(3-4)D or Dx(3-4)E [Natrinema hispanicum]
MTETRYDGLLLDHDGVIVTLCSHQVLRAAATDAFVDAGISNPSPDDVNAITIRVWEDDLCAVADRYGVDPDRLWQCREQRIEQTLRRETRAGRKVPYEDVTSLERVEVPTGIVSNNQTRIVEFVLREHGLYGYVETVRAREPTRESLQEKKPEPTYLEAAAADLDCSNPLYVGDSESDIVAGQRAGFDTVFLRRDHNATRHLEIEPTVEVESLSAVLELV